jgi:hypothetical protein
LTTSSQCSVFISRNVAMFHLLDPAKLGHSPGRMSMFQDEPRTSGREYYIGKARRRRKMSLMK